MTGSRPPGALTHLASTATRVAAGATAAADRADSLADQERRDVRALLHALGGGPPARLRETEIKAGAAAAAFTEAGAALREAETALQAYAARIL